MILPTTVHSENKNDCKEKVNNVIYNNIIYIHIIAFFFFISLTIGFIFGIKNLDVIPTTSFPSSNSPDYQLYNNNSFNPCLLIILSTFFATFDHALISLLGYTKPNLLKKYLFEYKCNPIRWIEYSISSSLLLVAIGILSGISDIHMWLLLFIPNFISMFFGYILEKLTYLNTHKKLDYVILCIYILISLLVFTPWIAPLSYFLNLVSTEKTPAFLFVSIFGTLFGFICFGINSFFYHILHLYEFYTAEYIYILLSFLTKFSFSVSIYGGFLSISK